MRAILLSLLLLFAGCAERRAPCTMDEWLINEDCQ